MDKKLADIATIIDIREDVPNILEEINVYLSQAADVSFTIGEGFDGPTASWAAKESPTMKGILVEVASMLRYKLDIAAWVD